MIADTPTYRIKPIPTRYAGVEFRSRAEARWAMVFDALALQWQYEVEGFNLETCWYEPDFWLPGIEAFAEVKGGSWQFDMTAHTKASELVRASGRPILICAEINPFLDVGCLMPDSTLPEGYMELRCLLVQSAIRGRVWIEVESPRDDFMMVDGPLLHRIEAARTHRFYVPRR